MRAQHAVGAILATSLLAACGGGGGGGGSSAAPGPGPVVTPTPVPVATATPTPGPTVRPGAIAHVVIIIQENRSFDNLFNGFPGSDTVQSGPTSTGATVQLVPVSLAANYDLDHSHTGFTKEYANGNMNGFDLLKGSNNSGAPIPAFPAYGFVPRTESAPYWAMATQFGVADRMFQTNQGPSYPGHQYLIAGQSANASENPAAPDGSLWGGCDAPAGTLVNVISSTGDQSQKVFPCFDYQTLGDLLDAKNISWKFYTPSLTYLWSAYDAIRHIRNGPDWAPKVITPETTILTDISGGRLPAVSWVVPTGKNSDHADTLSATGPQWVASIVNAVGASQYWSSTAIFVTWDDWGGWYDHVKPTIYNSYENSFRVPLIVVSPYAKHGYVSHVTHEFASILKFTEGAFGLPSLGQTDVRADDLSDMFDFTQSVRPLTPIQARLRALDFIRAPHNGDDPPDKY